MQTIPAEEAQSGGYFDGSKQVERSRDEEVAFKKVGGQTMPLATAKRILEGMDPNAPYRTRSEFVRVIAAFVSLHPQRLHMKTGKTTIHKMLIAVCDPSRIEWLLNQSRYRATLAANDNELLATGTTANERMHKEINACLRPVTLVTKRRLGHMMNLFHIRSMRRHVSAVAYDTTRQLRGWNRNRYLASQTFFTLELWREHVSRGLAPRQKTVASVKKNRQRNEQRSVQTGVYRAIRAKTTKSHRTVFE